MKKVIPRAAKTKTGRSRIRSSRRKVSDRKRLKPEQSGRKLRRAPMKGAKRRRVVRYEKQRMKKMIPRAAKTKTRRSKIRSLRRKVSDRKRLKPERAGRKLRRAPMMGVKGGRVIYYKKQRMKKVIPRAAKTKTGRSRIRSSRRKVSDRKRLKSEQSGRKLRRAPMKVVKRGKVIRHKKQRMKKVIYRAAKTKTRRSRIRSSRRKVSDRKRLKSERSGRKLRRVLMKGVKRRRVIRYTIPRVKKVATKAAEAKTRRPRIRSLPRKVSARKRLKPKPSGRKLKRAPIMGVKRGRVIYYKKQRMKKVIPRAAKTKTRRPRIWSLRQKVSARKTPKPRRSGRKSRRERMKVVKSMKGQKRPSKKATESLKSPRTKIVKKSSPKRQAKAALNFKIGIRNIKKVLHQNLELSTEACTFISEIAEDTYRRITVDLDKAEEINAKAVEKNVTRALPTALGEHAKGEGQRTVMLHANGLRKFKIHQLASKAKGTQKPAEVEASQDKTEFFGSNQNSTSKPESEFLREREKRDEKAKINQKEKETSAAEKEKTEVKTRRVRKTSGKPEQSKKKRTKSAKKSRRPMKSHKTVEKRKISGEASNCSRPAKRKI